MTCLLGLELGALKFDAACQLYHALSGQLFKVAWLTSLSPLNTLGLSDSPAYYKLRLIEKSDWPNYVLTFNIIYEPNKPKQVLPDSVAGLRQCLMKLNYLTHCLNVSTTPITAMGSRQWLSLGVVQLKGKHCRKPHCRNGVVDTFGLCHLWQMLLTTFHFYLVNLQFEMSRSKFQNQLS